MSMVTLLSTVSTHTMSVANTEYDNILLYGFRKYSSMLIYSYLSVSYSCIHLQFYILHFVYTFGHPPHLPLISHLSLISHLPLISHSSLISCYYRCGLGGEFAQGGRLRGVNWDLWCGGGRVSGCGRVWSRLQKEVIELLQMIMNEYPPKK